MLGLFENNSEDKTVKTYNKCNILHNSKLTQLEMEGRN